MRVLSYVVSLPIVICGLLSIDLPASAVPADITGTWEVTIHYPPPDGDYRATYVLKQDGEKVTGTYHGLHGPADVTGTLKADEVTLTVTVHSLTAITARFSGRLISGTKMSGTVTGTSSRGTETWSAEKKK
jgi:hypothetical protein